MNLFKTRVQRSACPLAQQHHSNQIERLQEALEIQGELIRAMRMRLDSLETKQAIAADRRALGLPP